MPHVWNYFETGHGKGEHDGAGACIKTALRREEMKFIGGRFEMLHLYRMVCICHGRTSNKETLSAKNILGGDKCGPITNKFDEHSAWN